MEPLPWESEVPPRILKLIHLALDLEWSQRTTLVARFQKPQAQPFFAGWEYSPKTNRWAFDIARVMAPGKTGLIPLSARDIAVYLEDPSVIYPEDPNA